MDTTRFGLRSLCTKLKEIDSKVGTPFYSYDWPTIEANLYWILSSASEANLYDNIKLYLAFFTLPNINLFKKLIALDPRIGINCNTSEEIIALESSGFTEWGRVIFSGGVLPEKDLVVVARTGCLVNVASQGNLKIILGNTFPCCIGLRLDFAETALKGFYVSEIESCLNFAGKMPGTIEALHAYPGTEVENLGRLIRHAEILISVSKKYPEIKEINFGGGFWYDYKDSTGDIRNMVDFPRYFKAVKDIINIRLRQKTVRIGWEPGRIVFAGAGFFVTKIIEIRRTSINTADVYVDASFTHIPVLKIRGRQQQVIVLDSQGKFKNGIEYEARICGATTLSTDQILPSLCPLPKVEVGDFLMILDAGAYGRAGSYNFLGKSKPPEILINDKEWQIIRQRQRATHLLEGLEDASKKVCDTADI